MIELTPKLLAAPWRTVHPGDVSHVQRGKFFRKPASSSGLRDTHLMMSAPPADRSSDRLLQPDLEPASISAEPGHDWLQIVVDFERAVGPTPRDARRLRLPLPKMGDAVQDTFHESWLERAKHDRDRPLIPWLRGFGRRAILAKLMARSLTESSYGAEPVKGQHHARDRKQKGIRAKHTSSLRLSHSEIAAVSPKEIDMTGSMKLDNRSVQERRIRGRHSRSALCRILINMAWLIAVSLALTSQGLAQGADCNDAATLDYINSNAGNWGPDGTQFKGELSQGDSQICYVEGLEEEANASAQSGYTPDGTWTVLVDSKYYGDGFKLMMFILHEMKHRQLHTGDPPEDPVAQACEEVEADCAAVEGVVAAAQAAGPPYPPGFCEGLIDFKNHFIQAWEICTGDWFPGFPAGCPELGDLLHEVCW